MEGRNCCCTPCVNNCCAIIMLVALFGIKIQMRDLYGKLCSCSVELLVSHLENRGYILPAACKNQSNHTHAHSDVTYSMLFTKRSAG